MVLLDRSVNRVGGGGQGKGVGDVGEQIRLVDLERQHRDALSSDDPGGDVALTAPRIDRHDLAGHVQSGQQTRHRRDLVVLEVDRVLGQDEPPPVAQALTRCSGRLQERGSPERRTVLPSGAITSGTAQPATTWTQRRNPASNWTGSIRAKTRPRVSCDGIPCGKASQSANHSRLARPHCATFTRDSAPLKTAQTVIVTISSNWCRLHREIRGSTRSQKQSAIRGADGTGIAGILDAGTIGRRRHPRRAVSIDPCVHPTHHSEFRFKRRLPCLQGGTS